MSAPTTAWRSSLPAGPGCSPAHVSLERDAAKTTLRVRTDWDTDEEFVVTHPGGDATRWFFPCDDQPNPTVNWEPVQVSSPLRL